MADSLDLQAEDHPETAGRRTTWWTSTQRTTRQETPWTTTR